jgi:hypothetical protein
MLLFQSCESSFLKNAVETLNPIPKVFTGMQWSTDNEVYINPNDFSIDGTMMGGVSGIFVNGGKKIWPIRDMKDNGPTVGKRAWSVKSSDEQNYPASIITAILKNNSSPSTGAGTVAAVPGDAITLNFGTQGLFMKNFVDSTLNTSGEEFPARGVKFSFLLTPTAFYGADSAALATDTLIYDFKLIKPASTVYGKHWLERYMYGTVSTSWTNGTGDPDLMKAHAEGQVATAVKARLGLYDTGNKFEFDDPAAPGVPTTTAISVYSWEPKPDLSLGWAPLKNYALALSPIHDSNEGGESFAPVTVSVPVVFTSNVGSVVNAVKDAIAAGTFGKDPDSVTTSPTEPTGYPDYIQHLGDTDDPDGIASGTAAVLKMIEKVGFTVGSVLGTPQVECSSLKNRTGAQTLTITFGPGADGSPVNTLSFTVWVNAK